MPLYEYVCNNNHKVEVLKKSEDRDNTTCPICNQVTSLQISKSNFRIATPISLFSHEGELIGWKADSGISPKPGQPYTEGN